jgi:deoxyribonuclease V
LVAGVDISAPNARGVAKGAVVVLSYPELSLVDTSVVEQRIDFPYIPGLLSFREAPVAVAAFEKLTLTPDLILVDAQGIAHPRRLGFASHLGLLLDAPTIGCAKSILCGKHQPLGIEAGCHAELIDNDEVVGAALRTKEHTTPIYVSIGHKVNLATALRWVMNCCRGYRLPEPTRLAHLAAGGRLPERLRQKIARPSERGEQLTFF